MELAASKLRLLGVDELAARLDDRFALLTGGTRTAPFRQQTLRAVFGWSHETLSPKEQAVWRRLAVFAGTFGLREAESICEGDPIAREEVFHLLGQLVDKSIVQAYPGAGAAESRYRLLDTIRHYGLEKLADSGEELAVRSRHCQAFVALAHNPSADPNLAQSAVSLATLDAAEENLCAALDWGLNYDPDSALRLCASLWRWWYDRARPVEPFRFLTAALSLPAAFEQPAKRVFLLNAASRLALQQGSTPAAVAFLEEALVISRELDDSRMIADSLLSLGGVRLEQGELEQALVCLHEALDRYRRVGNRLFESVGLMWLARLAVHRKELHEAKLMAMEGIRMSALSRHIPRFLYTLSEAAFAQGDLGTAHRYAKEAYHWNYSEEDPIARIVSALLLARAELADGNPVRALELVREALGLMRSDFRRSLGQALLILGAVLGALGHFERAARVHGATAAYHRLTATRTYAHQAQWRDGLVAAVRKALGDERFHQCWDEGERMTFREAIAYGLEELPPVPAEQAAPAVQAAPGGLTERELQVVLLVAAGLTDREIASQLYISRRTVDAHLRHIFNKVNVPTRAALTAWAVRSGLDRAEQSGP